MRVIKEAENPGGSFELVFFKGFASIFTGLASIFTGFTYKITGFDK